MSESARCAGCPNSKSPVVASEWHDGAELLLVGEAPGNEEISRGSPFIGPSGRLLGRHLQRVGIKRSDCIIANATSCLPQGPRVFHDECRKACLGRVRSEIQQALDAGVKMIVPLGGQGLKSVLGYDAPIMDHRGSITVRDGIFILPLLHPAFILRSPPWEPLFKLDVERVKRVLDHGWVPPEDEPGREAIYAWTIDEFDRGMALLEPAREIAIDVETTVAPATRCELICNGMSDGTTTLVYPWVKSRETMEPCWSRAEEQHICSSIDRFMQRHVMVTQNGPVFDHIVLDRYGMHVNEWEDTLMGQHAVRGHMPKNLGHVASTFLDIDPWKTYGDRSAGMEQLMRYNRSDCLRTILVWRLMKRELYG